MTAEYSSPDLSCPNCRLALNSELTCTNGHRFPVNDGVIRLLERDFGRRLDEFNRRFIDLRKRQNRRIIDPDIYPQLPHILADDPEWRQRSHDLEFIHKYLEPRSGLNVLDIGAWNGWLSYHLERSGLHPTAIDYFIDEYDGLVAKKHFRGQWRAIQMDLLDLEIFRKKFDLVILNRCIQFFLKPDEYLQNALKLVAPGGTLIITGMAFFKDAQLKIRQVQDMQIQYQREGIKPFKPVRGYLDLHDKARFAEIGVRFLTSPKQRFLNLKSLLVPTAPTLYYGVWP